MLCGPAHLVCLVVVCVSHFELLIKWEDEVFLITCVERPSHEHRDPTILIFLNSSDWMPFQILAIIHYRRLVTNRGIILEVAVITIRGEEEDVRVLVHAAGTWEEAEPPTVFHGDNKLNLISFFDVAHIDLSALDLERLIRPRVFFFVAISVSD